MCSCSVFLEFLEVGLVVRMRTGIVEWRVMRSAMGTLSEEVLSERREGGTYVAHDIRSGDTIYASFDVLFDQSTECSCYCVARRLLANLFI